MFQELNTYLIFPDRNDIYNFVAIKCFKDELNSQLVHEEMMDPGTDYSDYSWVIFENGTMIQG